MTRGDFREGSSYAPESSPALARAVVAPGEFVFAAAFLDHGHIYGQTNGLLEAGATLKAVYDPDAGRLAAFLDRYPRARGVDSFDEILGDPEIRLVASAAVPNRRADIGFSVMRAGKDYFTDKSPFTSLAQLDDARRVVLETERKYAVYYSERLHNEAAWHAGTLISEGAVGRVLQVLNLAPHRLSAGSRPPWFFDKACYGGILTDIGSHQVEQFLAYSGERSAEVEFARVANFTNPEHPELEDFGEMVLRGRSGSSFYTRVDWHTPDGSPVWGDGRTFIVGSTGTMEIRKYTDPGRADAASLILLVDGHGTRVIDCAGKVGFPFFGLLIHDCLNRTEHAMTQDHAFLAAELSMKAQVLADGSFREHVV